MGYYTDKKGHRGQVLVLASIINIIQFVLFLVVPTCPNGGCSPAIYIIPLSIGGFGNSFFGAVNSAMVALSVRPKYLNSAFGIYDCMQQLGNAVAPFPMGAILDKTSGISNGFFYFYVFTLGLAIL